MTGPKLVDPCVCGHTFGTHCTPEFPNGGYCAATNISGVVAGCNCQGFRPSMFMCGFCDEPWSQEHADQGQEHFPYTAEPADLHPDIAAAVERLAQQAKKEPLGVDVSDYGDEWVAGFLRGQVNALQEVGPVIAATLKRGAR